MAQAPSLKPYNPKPWTLYIPRA